MLSFARDSSKTLPVESGTVDYVISNCVINLSPDKPAVFREIARVLKPGGHFAVSDIVLLKALPDALVRDISAYVGCISGASLLTDYLSTALAAGLRDLSIPRIAHGSDLVKVLAPEGLATTRRKFVLRIDGLGGVAEESRRPGARSGGGSGLDQAAWAEIE